MNFLSADRQKVKELQAKVEEQTEKIRRYETKLSGMLKMFDLGKCGLAWSLLDTLRSSIRGLTF